MSSTISRVNHQPPSSGNDCAERMSRAFLNEDKFEQAGDELVERPVSPNPNYVTPAGIAQLQSAFEALSAERNKLKKSPDDPFAKQRLAEIERNLRYFQARLDSAILIDPASQNREAVLFSASVTVENEDGELQTYTIVGEDEADVASNKISWVSPLAKALIGHKVGDSVVWRRPAGNLTLDIISINYREGQN